MTILSIIFLSVYAIIVTRMAYVGHKRAGKLFQEKQMLIAENGRFSNAVRKKGIEAAQLEKQIKRLMNSGKIKISKEVLK